MVFARRLAYFLCLSTFALILLGGVVHTTGSSLACPDWPLCYGQVFPRMRGGILYEHGHRLLAFGVALTSVLLFALLGVQPKGTGGRSLAPIALTGVVFVFAQAALGGATVILRLPTLISTMHLATSMAFFAWAAIMTRRLHEEAHGAPRLLLTSPVRQRLGLAAGIVYLQIVLGAFVRHSGASLTCGPQAIWCNTSLWPDSAPQWVQSAHRFSALIATLAVVVGTVPVLKRAREAGQLGLRRLALSTHILVLLQMVLGVLTLKTSIHLHVVTTHLALGALLWVALAVLYASTRTQAQMEVSRGGERRVRA